MSEFLRPRIVAKLDKMAARLQELLAKSSDPEQIAKKDQFAAIRRELGSLQRTVQKYETFRDTVTQVEEHRSLLGPEADPELAELAELAKEELPGLEKRAKGLSAELIDDLIAEQSQGDRNAIVEIRAGTGGEEASLFARDLFELYNRFAERKGWKVELISDSRSDLGGYKEVVFSLSGSDVFRFMRFESGGHRVQRVPATESQGRIHTSAATIAVLPEAEEVDIDVRESDLEMQFIRGTGPGGQNVNKVASAVRMTHKPSGLHILVREERSQHKNKALAIKRIRSLLYDMEQQKQHGDRSAQRKEQVGTGDRNLRIRTYNFPQNRLTDHRINQNYSLDQVMEGKLEPVLEALIADDREKRIEEL